MGIKRIVDTGFWTDPDVVDLYSCEDKYFLLYLLTNPHTKQCGIYSLPKKFMAFETGYSKEVVEVLIDRFSKKYKKIVYNDGTQEIAVLNSLKYSVVKGGKPVEDCIKKDLSEVKDNLLIQKTYNHLLEFWTSSKRPFDQNIKLIFEEMIKKESSKERTNDNDNDNDNEESYHDSYHDSLPKAESPAIKPPSKGKKKIQEPKVQYSEYVTMTPKEHQKIVESLGEKGTLRCIEILNNYKGATGKTYKSDYYVMLNWVIDRYKQEASYGKRNTATDTSEIPDKYKNFYR